MVCAGPPFKKSKYIIKASPVFPKRLNVSDEFKDLVKKCLSFNPYSRPSCDQILQHPWMKADSGIKLSFIFPTTSVSQEDHHHTDLIDESHDAPGNDADENDADISPVATSSSHSFRLSAEVLRSVRHFVRPQSGKISPTLAASLQIARKIRGRCAV